MKRDPDALPTDPQTAFFLARVKRLTTERRYRERHRRFFIEGVRNSVAAVECGFAFDTIFHSDILLTSAICRRLVRQLRQDGVPIANVSPKNFRSISVAERASGIGAIVRQRVHRIDDVDPHVGICWIALSEIRSPGNLGSLLRTSAAAGGAGLILIGKGIDPYEPGIVRAAMGALFRQTLIRTTAAEMCEWVRRHQLQVVGASPDGVVPFHRFSYRLPTVLLLGEERKGLDMEQRRLCEELVSIPMAQGSDSLNVSVAGSLLMYEVFRHADAISAGESF
jgi:TrmH family RNA methyltransferase